MRRIKKPHLVHPVFAEFMRSPRLLEVLVALLGESGVRLHGSKLNLKSPEAVEIVKRLVPQLDVVVHNFRPGVMERLGVGYDDLRPLNERLIYAHASGWGDKGYKAKHPAFDIAAQARSGLMSMTWLGSPLIG